MGLHHNIKEKLKLKEKYVLIVHDVQLGEQSAVIYAEC